MSERVRLTCIICPLSCALTAEVDCEDHRSAGSGGDRRLAALSGNACRRGREYAATELTHPRRTLTSTVAIRGAAIARCPVRTAGEIPRAAIPRAMQEIAAVSLKAPVTVGQVLLPDLAGTGVPLIATRGLPTAGHSQE